MKTILLLLLITSIVSMAYLPTMKLPLRVKLRR